MSTVNCIRCDHYYYLAETGAGGPPAGARVCMREGTVDDGHANSKLLMGRDRLYFLSEKSRRVVNYDQARKKSNKRTVH